MTFTDKDLKKLKEDLIPWMSPEVPLKVMELKALLTRLEAAEKCVSYHECQDDLSTCPHLAAWRKSKGE